MDKKELKLSVTNCYVLEIGNKYLLIDTGYREDWELFCKRLKEVGVGLSEISHILLTHHHDDHCGLLNRVVEQNQDIKIIMSYRAKDYLLAGKNHADGVWCMNKRVHLLYSLMRLYNKRLETHPFPPYESRGMDILVKGETDLKEIGIGLNGRIIETLGHTLDSITVLFDDGDCFVGDAAANFHQFLGTRHCVVIIEDLEAYYASWRKLITEGARQIFPAHGRPFPAERMEQNIGKNSRSHMVMIS